MKVRTQVLSIFRWVLYLFCFTECAELPPRNPKGRTRIKCLVGTTGEFPHCINQSRRYRAHLFLIRSNRTTVQLLLGVLSENLYMLLALVMAYAIFIPPRIPCRD